MRYKDYPKEKVTWILQHKTDDEFWQFFNEIAGPPKKKLIKLLPKVDGFRANSMEGICRQLKNLLQYTVDSKELPRAQYSRTCFQEIWKTWIYSQPTLQQFLEKYDNEADFLEGQEPPPPNTLLDIGCFNHLAETQQIPRLLVQRFYEFGYFKQDTEIESILQKFPETIEPSSLAVMGLTLGDLPKLLQELHKRVSYLENRMHLTNQFPIESLAKMRELIMGEVSKRLFILENHYETLLTTATVLSNKMKEISQITLLIKQQLDTVNQDPKITLLKQHIKQMEQRLIDDLLPAMMLFQQQLSHSVSKAELNDFIQQFNQLKSNVEVQEELLLEVKSTSADNKGEYLVLSSGLYLSYLPTQETPIKELLTIEETLYQLINHLKNCGLKSDSAQELAKEVLAGLRSGELIVFSGALAVNVATACSQAITAGKFSPTFLHIPTGLLHGQQFHDYLWDIIKKAKLSGNLCAIILEGLNRSALESYAQTLHHLISQRLLGQSDPASHIIFFGTLITGATALPTPLELCELGPIFDTNLLEWDNQSQPIATPLGCISGVQWQSWLTQAHENIEITEPLHLYCQHWEFCHNPLWQRCVQKAHYYLDRQLSSLAFGWLVPRAIAEKIVWREIKEWLLESIFSGEQEIKDTRLLKLLDHHLRTEIK